MEGETSTVGSTSILPESSLHESGLSVEVTQVCGSGAATGRAEAKERMREMLRRRVDLASILTVDVCEVRVWWLVGVGWE